MCLLVIFPALVTVQACGLRNSLYFSSGMNFVGSLLRYMKIQSYAWVYLGTMCCAVSSAFSMSLPTFLSAEWFGTHERATATTIGVLAEHFGIAAGLGATMVVAVTYDSVVHYTFAQCLLSGIAMVAILIFVNEDRPQSPPSAAAAAKKKLSILQFTDLHNTSNTIMKTNVTSPPPITVGQDPRNNNNNTAITTMFFHPYYLYRPLSTSADQPQSYPTNKWKGTTTTFLLQAQRAAEILKDHRTTIVSLLSNSSVFLFAIVYGVSVGVFDAICTFLSQYLPYDPKECGYIGIVFVLVGFIGSFLVAFCMDSFTDRYWMATFSTTVGCAASMIFLWLTVWLAVESRFLIYTAIVLNGIFLSALISAGFEYGAAITYPSDENIVSGLLNCFSHVIAWALIECKEYISPSSTDDDESSSSKNNFFTYNALLSALLVGTCLLFFYFIEGESKRPLEDDDLSEEEEEVFIRR